MEPIYASQTLRIRDYDDNQYVVERMSIKATGPDTGASVWTIVGYCGSPKTALSLLITSFVGESARKARNEARLYFEALDISDKILALPKKGK